MILCCSARLRVQQGSVSPNAARQAKAERWEVVFPSFCFQKAALTLDSKLPEAKPNSHPYRITTDIQILSPSLLWAGSWIAAWIFWIFLANSHSFIMSNWKVSIWIIDFIDLGKNKSIYHVKGQKKPCLCSLEYTVSVPVSKQKTTVGHSEV